MRLLGIVAGQVILEVFLVRTLYPIHFQPQLLFSFWVVFVLGPLNTVLFWLIASHLFPNRPTPLLASLVFALSWWPNYLAATGSFNLVLLFLLLLSFYGWLNRKTSHFGLFLLIIGLALLGYGLSFIRITAFSDPGLVNSINNFRGQSASAGLASLGKLFENRPVYLSIQLLTGAIANLLPWNYFTAQAKLLGFSFTPPILLGLLPAYLAGAVVAINHRFHWLLLAPLLILPSLLSKNLLDLNRLILFFPVIALLTGLGVEEIITHAKKQTIYKLLLTGLLVTLAVQFVFSLVDINSNEFTRRELTIGQTHFIIE